MNKKKITIGLALIIFVASLSYAQQEEAYSQTKNIPEDYPSLSDPEIFQSKARAFLFSEPPVKMYVEELYDHNGDGKLQPAELKEFLSDVVFVVQRRGRAKITSDLIELFDKNHDGMIFQGETADILKIIKGQE